jgi:hypothetical protein
MIRRRATTVFSLAFLDCICCGFGAIILIFVLSINAREQDNSAILEDLRRVLAGQMATLARVRSTKTEVEQANARVTDMVVDARLKNDSLHALVDDLEKQLQYEKKGGEALLVDIDDLKKEIAARQKKPETEMVLKDVKPAPVGIPIGSNHIVFVIDTSGSMRDPNSGQLWSIIVRKFEEVLEVYPTLEGIQVLDADGRFVFGERGGGQWLTDSPEVREGFKRALRRYDIYSESNPVPGIFRALRTLYNPANEKMKMCIFLLGDEFSGTADAVIKRLDELNPADENGNRKVVINAVAFPTTIRFDFSMGNTGLKMANLMREVCYQHGGAFIALQDL